MARIRKDSTNWGGEKQKAILEGAFPDQPTKGKRKKTKKWCRGKVGMPHDYEKVEELWFQFNNTKHYNKCLRCKRCNKKVWYWDKAFKEFKG